MERVSTSARRTKAWLSLGGSWWPWRIGDVEMGLMARGQLTTASRSARRTTTPKATANCRRQAARDSASESPPRPHQGLSAHDPGLPGLVDRLAQAGPACHRAQRGNPGASGTGAASRPWRSGLTGWARLWQPRRGRGSQQRPCLCRVFARRSAAGRRAELHVPPSRCDLGHLRRVWSASMPRGAATWCLRNLGCSSNPGLNGVGRRIGAAGTTSRKRDLRG
jgi:hypothetical protein